QPVFRIILGDKGASAALVRAQTPQVDFFVNCRPAWTVAFREFGNTHRPGASANCRLALRNFWVSIHDSRLFGTGRASAPVDHVAAASIRSSACFGTSRLPPTLTVGSTPDRYATALHMPRILAASSMV